MHTKMLYSLSNDFYTVKVMNKEIITRHFKHLPVLCTERLVLRKILPSDYEDMYEYASKDEVTEYLLWSTHPSKEYTKQFIEYLQSRYRVGDFYDWPITLRDTGKMIGTCGFTKFDYSNNAAEIGYVLNSDYWGKGYCSEAVSKIIEFGFESLKLHRIEARYMKENIRSRNVMEKCGMIYEGTMKSAVYAKNKYRDVGICAIIKG
jgi:ribosomal-protein-alanine N-acetyltransferase